MPTVNFPLDGANIYATGQYFDGYVPANGSGTKGRTFYGKNGSLDFAVTGCTDVVLGCYTTGANASVWKVSTDGGSTYGSTLTLPSLGTWTDVTLATGLTEGNTYNIRLRDTSTSAWSTATWDLANGLKLTGSTSPTTVAWSSYGPMYPIFGGILRNQGCVEGGWFPKSVSGGSADGYLIPPLADCGQYCAGQRIKFRASFPSGSGMIRIMGFKGGAQYRVIEDGVQIGSVTTLGSTFDYDWTTLASSLTGTHDYEIFHSLYDNSGGSVAYEIMTPGGSIVAPLAANEGTRPVCLILGDSISTGYFSVTNSTSDYTNSFSYLIGKNKGYHVLCRGWVGACVQSTPNRTQMIQNRAMDWSHLINVPPSQVVVLAGTNDAGNANGITYSQAQFQYAYERLLQNLTTNLPDASVLSMGILPVNATPNSTNRSSANTAIQSAIAANGSSRITYFSTDGLIAPASGSDTTDNIHPNAGGHVKVYNGISPYIPMAYVFQQPNNPRRRSRLTA